MLFPSALLRVAMIFFSFFFVAEIDVEGEKKENNIVDI